MSRKRTRGRKFTFAAVGINTGDTLTFVDGTEVIAAENTTVVFRDESFTLSGFCKKFMPERMRTKSNSYRGCAFFYKDGMKLGTMFKNALSNTPISESEPDKRQDETKTVQLPRAELQTTKTELQRKSETLHPQLAPAGIINPPCDNIDTLERREGMKVLSLHVVTKSNVSRPKIYVHINHNGRVRMPAKADYTTCDANKLGAKVVSLQLMGNNIIHTFPLPPPINDGYN